LVQPVASRYSSVLSGAGEKRKGPPAHHRLLIKLVDWDESAPMGHRLPESVVQAYNSDSTNYPSTHVHKFAGPGIHDFFLHKIREALQSVL
jgi:hypothetical protein